MPVSSYFLGYDCWNLGHPGKRTVTPSALIAGWGLPKENNVT